MDFGQTWDQPKDLDPIEASNGLLSDEDLRLECVKAYSRAVSGSTVAPPAYIIKQNAQVLFDYIRGDGNGEVHSDAP